MIYIWLIFSILLVLIVPIVVLAIMIPIIIKSYKLLRIRLKQADQKIEEFEREEQKKKQAQYKVKVEHKGPTYEEWKAQREKEEQ